MATAANDMPKRRKARYSAEYSAEALALAPYCQATCRICHRRLRPTDRELAGEIEHDH